MLSRCPLGAVEQGHPSGILALELAPSPRRSWPRALSLAGAAVLGFLSAGLPTLDAPGYELGQVLALLSALLAPLAAFPAARAERARPAPSPARAALAASTRIAALCLAAF